MDLNEYLKSFNANMDISKTLTDDAQRRECSTLPGLYLHRIAGNPWSRFEIRDIEGRVKTACFYRQVNEVTVTGFEGTPNIPIYTVDDHGEAVRSLSRATRVAKWSEGQIAAMAEATSRPEFNGSIIEAVDSSLPAAICRVLLASYRMAALANDDRFRP